MASYQSTPYTSFDELFDTWKKQPQILETAVKNLSDKARFLGTGSDSAQSRATLDAEEQRLHDLATQTKNISKRFFDEFAVNRKKLSKTDLDTVTKVRTAIEMALKKYDTTVREISRKRQQLPLGSQNVLIDLENDTLGADDIQQRLQLQRQMQMNNALLQQQNEEQYLIEREVREVQTDIVEINQIMRDIGAMVSEQSPIIAQVERNVSAANDQIRAGNQQLNSAAGHQKKYRKKLCWLLLIFLIIAVIVTIVIILKVR